MASDRATEAGRAIVILTGPENWDDWITILRNKLDPDTWRLIRPIEPEGEVLSKPIRPTASDVATHITSIANLSANQIKAYEILHKSYEQDLRDFKEQKVELKKAREAIITTISERLRTTIQDIESPAEIIKQLYESTRPTQGFIARETTSKYSEALRGPRDLKSLPQ
jgi:hypothetical protein